MNKLVIFTGPSGVGKATIEKELFKIKDLDLEFSISATTREPRENEINGKHYHFISNEDFVEKIKNGEFIEWNEHFGNKYGTLMSEVQRIKKAGKIPFLEVETLGAKSVMDKFEKKEYISIFVSPPSIDELRKRITNRSTETSREIEERLERVTFELSFDDMFDYNVINDNIQDSVKEIENIIRKAK